MLHDGLHSLPPQAVSTCRRGLPCSSQDWPLRPRRELGLEAGVAATDQDLGAGQMGDVKVLGSEGHEFKSWPGNLLSM